MLLYLIQIEPLLSTLLNSLPAISIGAAMESVFAYVDDVDIIGQSEEDLLLADSICRQFEAMSRVIVNRNRKSAILGLGTWAGRQAWLSLGWPPPRLYEFLELNLQPPSMTPQQHHGRQPSQDFRRPLPPGKDDMSLLSILAGM